jgi:hypothetical protein
MSGLECQADDHKLQDALTACATGDGRRHFGDADTFSRKTGDGTGGRSRGRPRWQGPVGSRNAAERKRTRVTAARGRQLYMRQDVVSSRCTSGGWIRASFWTQKLQMSPVRLALSETQVRECPACVIVSHHNHHCLSFVYRPLWLTCSLRNVW